MLLIVFLAIAALFLVLGIVFAAGKGANLIAGYNTASPEEKAKAHEKKLLKAMSVLMFVLAGCFVIRSKRILIDINSTASSSMVGMTPCAQRVSSLSVLE